MCYNISYSWYLSLFFFFLSRFVKGQNSKLSKYNRLLLFTCSFLFHFIIIISIIFIIIIEQQWLHKRLQLVSITTKVVSSNPTYYEVYSIQFYVIKFVSDLRQIDGFLRVLWLPHNVSGDMHWFWLWVTRWVPQVEQEHVSFPVVIGSCLCCSFVFCV